MQVFLKQDLLESFLEDVSVLHGELLHIWSCVHAMQVQACAAYSRLQKSLLPQHHQPHLG